MAMLQLKDDSMHRELKKYAEENGTTLTDLVENIVFDFLFNKGLKEKVADHFIKKDDYETMARALVNKFMQTHMKQFSAEICDITLKIPMWQHLLGMYRLTYDQGQWPSPYVDPAWMDFASRYAATTSKSICGRGTDRGCGQEFAPMRLGQLFCNNKCAATHKLQEVPA